ncbi:CLUMA_CG011822, isoform A [Clunio marinus]|uniref:CLUMA_CG011822, isoform A n=1 Tax=Clunio marinus TaxID=568069 RepID=A0A1J1IJ50_9DIPT|nr:CLUMA_CG011822, isoform A [Clunio marinus]
MKFHIINKQKILSKTPLKIIILENFCRENGKFFYSIEVTPKEETKIYFTKLKIQPLFVDITWIKNFNLITPIEDAPALKLANEIKSTHVVNSVTCYGLEDHHIEKVLRSELKLKNFTVLRGDYVDSEQKYKFANELIKEIRRRTSSEEVTIFCAGYSNTHNEAVNADEDLQNLKRKVESGVDAILTLNKREERERLEAKNSFAY